MYDKVDVSININNKVFEFCVSVDDCDVFTDQLQIESKTPAMYKFLSSTVVDVQKDELQKILQTSPGAKGRVFGLVFEAANKAVQIDLNE